MTIVCRECEVFDQDYCDDVGDDDDIGEDYDDDALFLYYFLETVLRLCYFLSFFTTNCFWAVLFS